MRTSFPKGNYHRDNFPKTYVGALMECDIVAIEDCKVERISVKEHHLKKIGNYNNDFMEKIQKDIVRPVFKAKLTQDHNDDLQVPSVWLDVDQLTSDSGSLKLVQDWITKKYSEKSNEEQQSEDFLRVIKAGCCSVGGGISKGNKKKREAKKKEEESKIATTKTKKKKRLRKIDDAEQDTPSKRKSLKVKSRSKSKKKVKKKTKDDDNDLVMSDLEDAAAQ